jgi:hypothetical protein
MASREKMFVSNRMAEPKFVSASADEESPYDNSFQETPQVLEGDTAQDVRDMLRLGKAQEFKRNFSLLSTLGFISM